MNIIKRLKRAAWSSFETFAERRLDVYSYPPASPEPVRSDPHGVLAQAEAERATAIGLHAAAGVLSPSPTGSHRERVGARGSE